ncbi:hypothetical protein BpHYR1_053602, partial [Brachionus plicatilis]
MWHNQLLKLKNISYKRESQSPVFTGYYGMGNTSQSEQQIQFNRQKGWRAPNGTLDNREVLYQKNSRKNNRSALTRHQLYEKYKTQKKAENDFYVIQSQIAQTENLIGANPHLASYYAAWLQQAKETLKECTSIIESPDNVSFSSVYGYSKDEELITLYRNPQFSSELQKIQNNPAVSEMNSMVPYFNSNNSNIYRYDFNARNLKPRNVGRNLNFSNRSLQLSSLVQIMWISERENDYKSNAFGEFEVGMTR